MARFDIYRSGIGFNLDVQADLLSGFTTRLVVPLLPPDHAPPPGKRLNPTFEIGGEPYVMVTQFLAAVRLNAMGKPVGNLSVHYDRIGAALDMIFLGF